MPHPIVPDKAGARGTSPSEGTAVFHPKQSDLEGLRTQKDEVSPLERRNHKVLEGAPSKQRQKHHLVHDLKAEL